MKAQNIISGTPGNEEMWGKYASMFSLGFILSFLLDLGLSQLLTKEIASNDTDKKLNTSTALSLKLISSFLYPLFILGIGYLLDYREKNEIILLLSISLIHVGIQFFSFFRGIIQGNQLFKIDALLSNVDKALLVLFVLILLLWDLNMDKFVLSRIASICLAALLCLALLIKNKLLQKPKYNRSLAKSLLKKGMPFAFITLVYSVNEQVDQVMVERLSLDNNLFDEAGVYSAAYRIVNGIMMYLWIILPVFFAKFAHHKTSISSTQKLIKTGTTIVFLPVAFISIGFMVHGELFFGFFFDRLNTESVKAISLVFATLCLTLLLQGLFAILSTYLTSTGQEKNVTLLVSLSVLFNLTSNYLLVPSYGALAAAWTTFGSATIVVIGYVLLVTFKNDVKLPYLTWIKLSVIALTTYFILHFTQKIPASYSILCGTVTFIVCTVLIKPIRLKELRSIS